jgi:hypothetical protein
MKLKFIQILFILLVTLSIQGCGVGSLVAAPFKVVGAVVNIVTPDIIGDTIAGTGDVLDTAIPF